MENDQKEMLKIGAEAAMRPFADLIDKLFGGPVEQIGGMWTDRLAVRRHIRRISLFGKLQAAIDKARFDPRQIPDNVWIPAIQEASLQDDETLQEKWANLLANAADPRAEGLPPSFPKILSELSSREARFLDRLYDYLASSDYKPLDIAMSRPMRRGELFDVYMQADLYDASAFSIDMDGLLRNRLIELETAPLDREALFSGEPIAEDNEFYRMSSLGKCFVAACLAPSPEPRP